MQIMVGCFPKLLFHASFFSIFTVQPSSSRLPPYPPREIAGDISLGVYGLWGVCYLALGFRHHEGAGWRVYLVVKMVLLPIVLW